mmetsp:Transcript_1862/g.3760  ORF Transcript_1862/g.3760 Transcript_1862/m.3760 type:complete len:124 (-) Transcript_1862:153-524(-)
MALQRTPTEDSYRPSNQVCEQLLHADELTYRCETLQFRSALTRSLYTISSHPPTITTHTLDRQHLSISSLPSSHILLDGYTRRDQVSIIGQVEVASSVCHVKLTICSNGVLAYKLVLSRGAKG